MDSRGILRGSCLTCGEDECKIYDPKTDTDHWCNYCGCPPIKHKRVQFGVQIQTLHRISTSDTESIQMLDLINLEPNDQTIIQETDLNQTSSNPSNVHSCRSETPVNTEASGKLWPRRLRMVQSRKGVKVVTGKPTGAKRSDNTRQFTLPNFSPYLRSDLLNDEPITQVWKLLVDESAAHFLKQNPQNRGDYAIIGKLLYLAYPKIKLEGRYPWTSYTSCLSRKIRKERIRIDMEQKLTVEVSVAPVSDNGEIPSENMDPSCSVFPDFVIAGKPIRESTQTSMTFDPQKYKNALDSELLKERSCDTVIRECIAKTFQLRTDMSVLEKSPIVVMKEFGFFKTWNLVLWEFEILLGADAYKVLMRNVKELAARMQGKTFQGTVKAWVDLQTRLSSKDTFFLKFCPNDSSYADFLKGNDNSNPHILVRYEEDFVDAVVCGFGNVIPEIQSIEDGLLVAFGLYCTLRVTYPKSYLNILNFLEAILFGANPKLPRKVLKEVRSMTRVV